MGFAEGGTSAAILLLKTQDRKEGRLRYWVVLFAAPKAKSSKGSTRPFTIPRQASGLHLALLRTLFANARALPSLALAFEILRDIRDNWLDKLLYRLGILTYFPLRMLAVAQLEEVEKVREVYSSPERYHHVLRKHSSGLFAADA